MTPLAFSEALRRGFTHAVSLWRSSAALFLARAAQAIASSLFVGLWVLPIRDRPAAILGGGLVAAWMGAAILRALAVAAGLRQGQRRSRAQPPGSVIAEGGAVAQRALAFVALGFATELVGQAFVVFALGTAGVSYVSALFGSRVGIVAPSFALALAIGLAGLLHVAFRLWLDVAFARCVRRDEPFAQSLFEAAGALARRLGAPVGIWLTTGVLALVYRFIVSVIASGLPSLWDPGASAGAALAASALVGVVSAYVPAILEMSRMHAYAALDMDAAGEHPVPAETHDHLALSPLLPHF